MSVGVGSPQFQAAGVLDYKPELCNAAAATEKEIVVMNEKESEEPLVTSSRGCPGTVTEPGANAKKLCVFTAAGNGIKEALWKNIKAAGTAGQAVANNRILLQAGGLESLEPGQAGELIVLRTAQWTEATTTVTAISAATLQGTWAMTQ
jgi:hypothetical protein